MATKRTPSACAATDCSEGHERLHTWRLADYVADLEKAVGTMPSPPVLIGHSMGGMVMQKYLENHAGIAGVVLMASVPPQGLLPTNLHMAMRHPFLFQQMALFSLLGPELRHAGDDAATAVFPGYAGGETAGILRSMCRRNRRWSRWT